MISSKVYLNNNQLFRSRNPSLLHTKVSIDSSLQQPKHLKLKPLQFNFSLRKSQTIKQSSSVKNVSCSVNFSPSPVNSNKIIYLEEKLKQELNIKRYLADNIYKKLKISNLKKNYRSGQGHLHFLSPKPSEVSVHKQVSSFPLSSEINFNKLNCKKSFNNMTNSNSLTNTVEGINSIKYLKRYKGIQTPPISPRVVRKFNNQLKIENSGYNVNKKIKLIVSLKKKLKFE